MLNFVPGKRLQHLTFRLVRKIDGHIVAHELQADRQVRQRHTGTVQRQGLHTLLNA